MFNVTIYIIYLMSDNCLRRGFFCRRTPIVARELIGKILVRSIDGKVISGVITDVEAYCGFKDSASHARFGLTKRNYPMFGPPGVWYVYRIYGIHWMLNIVTEVAGYPAAVLLRGIEKSPRPAQLTTRMGIDGKLNNTRVESLSGLWIKKGIKVEKSKIIASRRIRIDYAAPYWRNKRWRFYLKPNREIYPSGVEETTNQKS